MSHLIITKKQLSENVFTADFHAPLVAQARQPGQFVIISISNDYSERIPLTIAGANPENGTITLIWQRVGKTTDELSELNVGDSIANIAGPLGKPTIIKNFGTVVCVGGGIGNAPLLPIATALKNAGNKLITIIGARNKDLLILEDEFTKISDKIVVTTDDGSHGRKALVTEPLREACMANPKPAQAFIIGPTPMMKFCCKVTEEFAVPTEVSLNTIMIDGTGMCGGCRVEVGGETKFVCVDGPEFDGHKVNFDLMMKRMRAYTSHEKESREKHKEHKCKLDKNL